MRLGLNGVPRGSDAGSFSGKTEQAPSPDTGVQGIYSPITRLHVHRREIIVQDIRDWVYARLYNTVKT